ncbi:glycosyltransferase [Candidatus Parcubacteria bacterium]|nr:glycosyltransferase [Candidatus Parcubacteria bacterium]
MELNNSENNSKQFKVSKNKQEVMKHSDKIALNRIKFVNKNKYYYKDLIKFFKYNILNNSKILEIGCGDGYLLNKLSPKHGVGIDISSKMIEIAKNHYPDIKFYQMDAENITLDEKFDYIIISDTLGYFEDIQKVFQELKKVSKPSTRIIITYHNFIWSPFLKLAEKLNLKMPQKRLNWLNGGDVNNLLYIENYDVIKKGKRFLFPKKIFLISNFINKFIAQLPIINSFCLTGYIIARQNNEDKNEYSTSIIIPARNEKGNIENAVKRMPNFGKHIEIIFIEGHSRDDTYGEIKRVYEKYKSVYDIKYAKQDGKGKGDAVRKGFEMANGDILMILDADLTVPPEDLPKFYNAIASGKGEYINGSRLVYPMEDEAMRTLNMIGNKFFSLMFSWLLGQRIKDTLCGTKVISKNNYKKLIANRKYFGEFDPFGDFDLIFGSSKLSLKFIEIPIKYKARDYGDTNISRFRHGWILLKMLVFAIKKIKFI